MQINGLDRAAATTAINEFIEVTKFSKEQVNAMPREKVELYLSDAKAKTILLFPETKKFMKDRISFFVAQDAIASNETTSIGEKALLKQELASKNIEIINLHAKVADRDTQIADHGAKISDLYAKIANHDIEMSDFRGKLADRDARIADLSEEKRKLENRLREEATLLNDRAQIESKVSSLEHKTDSIVIGGGVCGGVGLLTTVALAIIAPGPFLVAETALLIGSATFGGIGFGAVSGSIYATFTEKDVSTEEVFPSIEKSSEK